MINIILSEKAYDNDVYPIIKAFYPEEGIKVYSREEFAESITKVELTKEGLPKKQIGSSILDFGRYDLQYLLQVKQVRRMFESLIFI